MICELEIGRCLVTRTGHGPDGTSGRPSRAVASSDRACCRAYAHGMSRTLPHDLDRIANAEAYNRWIIDRARPWLRGRSLDVGAGIGTHTAALVRAADEVVALEPDPWLASILRSTVEGIEVVVGDLAAVEGPFDTIVCFNVLEHIERDSSALGQLHRLLSPDGTLLLLVPAHGRLFNSLDVTFKHARRYSIGEVAAKLMNVGFSVEELRYVNPVGALGWFLYGTVLRREHLPEGGLFLFNHLVPALRRLDRIRIPFGLSVWAIAVLAE
jgi:SAM-dependent methyltransferase